MLRFILLAIAIFFGSTAALATSDLSRTITTIGSQGSQGFMNFSVVPSAGCLYDSIYFDVTTAAGQSYMSMALSARVAHLPVQVDYTKNSPANAGLTPSGSDLPGERPRSRSFALGLASADGKFHRALR